MNSRVLVGIQFLTIFVIMIPKASVMISSFWWVCLLIATVMALWIFTHNRVGNFNVVPEIRDNAKLIVTGPYRFVRHPMYSALILFMLGIILWHFNWVNVLCLSIMIAVISLKSFREERLWSSYHKDYLDYKARTKMIIPFIL
ncbi:MAG TPA: isoprenylcysteine carboxylmethyltransferase family protein [Campylobacterales bacterium]|nr:isoprenylcysteine carboxylmethyltransferase family protein [Campylobacterales bacterium]